MKRYLELSSRLRRAHSRDETTLAVDLTGAEIAPFCLEMLLLDYGLADSVTLRPAKDKTVLLIRLESGELGSHAEVRGDRYIVSVNRNDLGMVIQMCLQYQRDGFVSASHVDIGLARMPGRMPGTLVVTVR